MEEGTFRGNVAIVGLGLIGGSYAMALRKLIIGRLFGIDIDQSVLDKAVSCGVIDEGSISSEEILSQCDMIILALYPEDTIEFIKDNARYFKAGAIITDTCGIKQPIIKAAVEHLPQKVEFVGGHPMAGNEHKGFDAASPELFLNTNYILTPHEGSTETGLMAVEKLAAAIGCICVTRISPEEHDSMMSYTSQLPHIVAIALTNLIKEETNMNAFTGRSFRDATRVAALNKELWTQIFRMNKTNIIDRIEDMEEILKKLKNAIIAQKEENLKALFDNAIKGKRVIG